MDKNINEAIEEIKEDIETLKLQIQLLENLNLSKSIERCKCRFDFYVNQEYIIEFDGKQHFEECKGRENTWFTEENLKTIRQRDEYKNNWCKKHNIPLIRIPYYVLENLTIEDLLLETTKYLV